MEPFYQYLKNCRLASGYTIEQVSQATDISDSLICQYETNKSFPNGKNLIKLARFYRFSLDDLFCIFPKQSLRPPVYNMLGHPVCIPDFPFCDNAGYYQISAFMFVLVKYEHHYHDKEDVLAFRNGKAEILTIIYCASQFYLLDKNRQLYPYDSPDIRIMGPIIQYLKLSEG